MKFKIIGQADYMSKEEIRCMLSAAATVLEYHNKNTEDNINQIKVMLVPRETMMEVKKGKQKGSKTVGTAWRKYREIELDKAQTFDKMFTIIIHEMIHIYMNIPDDRSEKATCMLTNRLKPWIAQIYEVLIDGIYKRAGYIAHAKISYKTADGVDDYDDCQWEKVSIKNSAGIKMRIKKTKRGCKA